MIIYQLLPRLFGNNNPNCKPNGTYEENKCGKLNDITIKTLNEIKSLGITHIWYTGIISHATQTDFSEYGIPKNHPSLVKGKAGSPYSIKDYYDVSPDLATKPENRFKEFKNLINRTHKAGLKVIIDFVPNHVAREYNSQQAPKGVVSLGKEDNKNLSFSPNNNFYYLPNQIFKPPFDIKDNMEQSYIEVPAKVTGNDCFSPYPSEYDWYETIKLNYGIDISNNSKHFYPTPDTWWKMLDILKFWSSQDIDGFRCDMAEMVPCEFWGWAIDKIRENYPNIIFIAEVYNPNMYRDYLYKGHFDYLYDKVGLYDTLRNIICNNLPASKLTDCWQKIDDIHNHMLNFLENHDEQRIASEFFANNPYKAIPALIVSSCMRGNPFMLYFGQELGEKGMDEEGYSGRDGRTTIFDYWSVKTIREWRNRGKYDSKHISQTSQEILNIYRNILNIASNEETIKNGTFFDLTYANLDNQDYNSHSCFTFFRKFEESTILISVNFSEHTANQKVIIPQHAFDCLNLPTGKIKTIDLISKEPINIYLAENEKTVIDIPAYSGLILKFVY